MENLSHRNFRTVRYIILLGTLLSTLFFGLLSVMVVPAPKTGTSQEVSGRVLSIGQPYPYPPTLTTT